MAAVFKRGRDKSKKNKCYVIQYWDHEGKRQFAKGFTDKALTEQLAAKIESEVMLRKRGMIDPEQEKYAAQKKTPITDHLEAFEKSLGKNNPKHVTLTMSRIRRVVKQCEFRSLADISSEAVENVLSEMLADEEIGHRTYNHYIQAIDSFCNWCVTTKRLLSNPLLGLERQGTRFLGYFVPAEFQRG